MSNSKQEEIIAILWLIAALSAFNGGYDTLGWIFVTKSVFDTICSIIFAIMEIKKAKNI